MWWIMFLKLDVFDILFKGFIVLVFWFGVIVIRFKCIIIVLMNCKNLKYIFS